VSHIKNGLRIEEKNSKIKPTREHEKKNLADKETRKKGKNENNNRNAPSRKTQLNSK
jgi:hypothetical protein